MKVHLVIVVALMTCMLLLIYYVYLPFQRQSIVVIKDPLVEWIEWIDTYLTFPLDEGYGSHAIVLLAAVFVSKTGPILELGMGKWSSPLLHRLALEQNRFLRSADSDLRWIKSFSYLNASKTQHDLQYVEVKSEMGIEWAIFGNEDDRDWTVVFIDHRPGPRRQFDLMIYAERCDVIVLHDTDQASLYQYEKAYYLFPYRYRFKGLKTFTDVLSGKNETLINSIRYLLESIPYTIFPNRTSPVN